MKRRVIFLSRTLAGGGAEKQLLLTAAGLAERGWDCHVVSLTPPMAHRRYARLIDRCRQAGVVFVYPEPTEGKWRVLGALVGSVATLRRPVLWTWGFSAEALRLAFPPLWWAVGLVAVRDASEGEARRKGWLLGMGSVLTRAVVANSERAIALFAAEAPGLIRKAHLVYNAVELPPPAPVRSGGSLRVAMLGNILFWKKGYDRAIKLAGLLHERRLPIRIVIAGWQAPTEPDLAALIRAKGLENVLSYDGLIEEPLEWLAKADAFLMLSRFEGTPNALLEAMAIGLPCVTSDVGDVARFAAEGAGVKVVTDGDPAKVCAVLEHLLCDRQAAAELGRRNRAYCSERFAESRMIGDTAGVLERL